MEGPTRTRGDAHPTIGIDRRTFLRIASPLTELSLRRAIAGPTSHVEAALAPRLSDYLFTLGFGSGDPLPSSVVLWTRLAPDPLDGVGIPPRAIPVEWKVAVDDRFRHVVQWGSVMVRPALGHSVHVEVSG